MPKILCMWQIEIINFISCKHLLSCSWLGSVAQASASPSLRGTIIHRTFILCFVKANGVRMLSCILFIRGFEKENFSAKQSNSSLRSSQFFTFAKVVAQRHVDSRLMEGQVLKRIISNSHMHMTEEKQIFFSDFETWSHYVALAVQELSMQ